MDDIPSIHGHDWLPQAAPLEMPQQDLAQAPAAVRRARAGSGQANLWRAGMLVATAVGTALPGRLVWSVLSIGGVTALDAATEVLFLLLFGWLVFGAITAAIGYVVLITGGTHPSETGVDVTYPRDGLKGRTAILVPIYNEDASQVAARMEVMGWAIPAHHAANFDFYLLSDSQTEPVRAAERIAYMALRRRWQGLSGLYYRARDQNIGRKAGNIAHWVREFGGAYEHMVVLDADSLMGGMALVRLAAAMQRNPDLGLLQTAPTIVRATSLFGRLQQFASRLYGPIHATGLAWWSGAEGNYWGHNAIIRVAAFAESAGLPRLVGPRPFGGEILSHDFVEAALLRRAGWEVRMTTELPGTYEECPPTLADMVVRERRWCQGNLQHSAVIAAGGLHWASRIHLLRGISTYLVAPLWLAFILVAILQALRPDASRTGEWDASSLRILTLITLVTIGGLLAPKGLGVLWAMHDRVERLRWARPWAMLQSVVLEILLSALIAPVLMMAQARAAFDVICGRDSGWTAQARTARTISWREALRLHAWQMGGGALFLALTAFASPAALIAGLPIALGLVLAAPIEKVTASVNLGRLCADRGLLTTPEDRSRGGVLEAFAAHPAVAALDPAAGASPQGSGARTSAELKEPS